MRHILLLVLLNVSLTFGYQYFQTSIPNGQMVPNPCDTTKKWPGVGHRAVEGQGPRNPFGADFEQDTSWSKALCQKDSDGDGRSNGEELGDPNCTWKVGQEPEKKTGLSHPGVCEPISSDDCKTKNTFLNCPSTGPPQPSDVSTTPVIMPTSGTTTRPFGGPDGTTMPGPTPAADNNTMPAPSQFPAADNNTMPVTTQFPSADNNTMPVPSESPASDSNTMPVPTQFPAADNNTMPAPSEFPADENNTMPVPTQFPGAEATTLGESPLPDSSTAGSSLPSPSPTVPSTEPIRSSLPTEPSTMSVSSARPTSEAANFRVTYFHGVLLSVVLTGLFAVLL